MTRIRRLYFKPDYSASPDFFVGPIGHFLIWRLAIPTEAEFQIIYEYTLKEVLKTLGQILKTLEQIQKTVEH